MLRFVGEEAWRIRFSGVRHASLRWGASDAGESCWRQLRKPRRKIPGDKKHVEGILSQSHCVAQFNTAQNRRIVTTRSRLPADGSQSRQLFQLGQLQEMGSGITETCFGHFHHGMTPSGPRRDSGNEKRADLDGQSAPRAFQICTLSKPGKKRTSCKVGFMLAFESCPCTRRVPHSCESGNCCSFEGSKMVAHSVAYSLPNVPDKSLLSPSN